MSCVRRTVDFEMKPSGQQYAFIRYSTPQEAMNAIQQGEVDIQGRKLLVTPTLPDIHGLSKLMLWGNLGTLGPATGRDPDCRDRALTEAPNPGSGRTVLEAASRFSR